MLAFLRKIVNEATSPVNPAARGYQRAHRRQQAFHSQQSGDWPAGASCCRGTRMRGTLSSCDVKTHPTGDAKPPRQSRWRAGWGFPAAPALARRRPSSSPAPRPAGNRAAPSGSLTAGSVRVIVGNYARHQGPAQTFTSVNARDVRLARSKKHRPALARFLRASATQGSSAT